MKANELRLGNLVRSKLLGSVHAITGFLPSGSIYTDLQESYSDSDDWEPERLTPKTLEKSFNCIRNYVLDWGTFIEYELPFGTIEFTSVRGELKTPRLFIWSSLGDKESYAFEKEVGYVHELQNIYFALIGEELTVLC